MLVRLGRVAFGELPESETMLAPTGDESGAMLRLVSGLMAEPSSGLDSVVCTRIDSEGPTVVLAGVNVNEWPVLLVARPG